MFLECKEVMNCRFKSASERKKITEKKSLEIQYPLQCEERRSVNRFLQHYRLQHEYTYILKQRVMWTTKYSENEFL